MNKEELIETTKNNIEQNISSITCLIGKNATNKTTTLNEIFDIFKNNQNYNCLYFRSETTLQNEISMKQNGEQLLSDINKFIKNILCIEVEIKQEDILNNLKSLNSNLNDIKNIVSENDEYYVREISNIFSLDQKQKNDVFYYVPEIKSKPSIKKYSSGQGMYSLLFFCCEILKKF